jgi:hypothetical protein
VARARPKSIKRQVSAVCDAVSVREVCDTVSV